MEFQGLRRHGQWLRNERTTGLSGDRAPMRVGASISGAPETPVPRRRDGRHAGLLTGPTVALVAVAQVGLAAVWVRPTVAMRRTLLHDRNEQASL